MDSILNSESKYSATINPEIGKMKTAFVQVEIPNGLEIADPVMRAPKSGELYLNHNNTVLSECNHPLTNKYVIVKRAYNWPEWLKANWIAKAPTGLWYAFWKKPVVNKDAGNWYYAIDTILLNQNFFDFTPPDCKSNWEDSAIKNPNYEGDE